MTQVDDFRYSSYLKQTNYVKKRAALMQLRKIK